MNKAVLSSLLPVAALLFLQPALQANPKGAQVTAGTITINEGPGVMTINQTTPRGIIHWQDFSIGAGELTQFIHLDAKSATLNRVVGGIPSSIQGTLQANGQVFLINPNGILIGPTGRVNTAAFVASTLDVPDAQFLAGGDTRFTGPSLQGVVNLGVITASGGDVVLMARNVVNAGTISAPNGTVALAAGNDIVLQAAGDERVVVVAGTPGGGTGVENSGRIEAARAELKAAGGNVYALAINNTGIVKATGITQMDGRIILGANGGIVQNSGQLIAKNADGSGGRVKMDSGKGGQTINNGTIDASASDPKKNGGTVELLGDTVTVGGSSVISVNGANAGTVAIGVSAGLANQTTATGGIATVTATTTTPAVPGAPASSTAQQTLIQANSRILANSTGLGNGGRVVVWSEKQTVVAGTIEAKGGALGGDGGLVETSGRTGLTIVPGTKVDTSAPKGKPGTWLLDPAGISIDNSATDTTVSSGTYTQNANLNHVLASDLLTALAGGSNVTVTSTGNNLLGWNADIEVNADLPMNNTFPAVTLDLHSAGGITINNSIGGAGTTVALNMEADGGGITVLAPVRMNGITATAANGFDIQNQLAGQNDERVKLTATGGNIAFSGSGNIFATSNAFVILDTSASATGTINGTASTSISAGHLAIYTGAQGVATSANPLHTAVTHFAATVSANAATGGGVYISNSGGDLHIGGADVGLTGIQTPPIAGYGGVEIANAGGDLLLDSPFHEVIRAAGDIKLKTTGTGNDISITNIAAPGVRSVLGSVTLDSSGEVNLGDGASHAGVLEGKTGVTVTAAGDITLLDNSKITADGGTHILISSTGGLINFQTSGTAIDATGGAVALTANGSITALGTPTAQGSAIVASLLSLNAGAAINLSSFNNQISTLGDISRGGDLTIRNTLPLTIAGDITGGNTASNVTIRTVGNIVLGSTAKFATSGAHTVTLEAFNGHFINFADPTVFASTGGARYRVYSKDDLAPFSTGSLPTGGSFLLYIYADTLIGSDPAPSYSPVFYFQDVNAAAQNTTIAVAQATAAKALADKAALQLSTFEKFSADQAALLKAAQTATAERQAAAVQKASAEMASAAQAQSDAQRAMIAELGEDNLNQILFEQRVHKSGYSLQSVVPAVPLDFYLDPDNTKFESAMGWYPVPYTSLALQYELAYKTSPVLSQVEMEMVIAGGGRDFNLNQAGFLTSANVYYLALMGYNSMIADGTIKDPDKSILKHLSALAAGGGALTPQQADSIIDAGPVGITPGSQGIVEGVPGVVVDGVFGTSNLPKHGSLQGKTAVVIPQAMLDSKKDILIPTLVKAGAPLITNDGGSLVSHDGGTLVSHDGGTLISQDGGGLVAGGGGNFVASGGGNLVSHDGGTLVSHDGGTLVSHDGGTLVSHDGGTLVSHDGGTLVSHDGGTLVSHDGGTIIGINGGNVVSNDGASAVNLSSGGGLVSPAMNLKPGGN